MKILVLTSRYTATRDIISEDFGRQIRLFQALGKYGHDIHFFCADYKKFENRNVKLHGINVMIRPYRIMHIFQFTSDLNKTLKNKKYDVLIATSDPSLGLIGYIFAKKHKIKFIYDLQDNYEVYFTYNFLIFGLLDKISIRKADFIITVSSKLKKKIRDIRSKNVFVIPNGVDRGVFKPMNKKKCRKEFGLSDNSKIIVYSGSILRNEGVDRLVQMFKLLRQDIDDCILVIAGRYIKGEKKYIDLNQNNIIYLGSLSQDKVAKLINAGDVAIVPYTNNKQVTYGFPYKLVEYMACEVPIVATRVGDVEVILSKHQSSLCSPDDIKDMKNHVISKFKSKKCKYDKELKDYTWDAIARKLDKILRMKKLVEF